MSDGQQSLAQVKEELLDRIDGVDRKVDGVEQRLLDRIDAVDRKVEAVDHKVDGVGRELRETRTELVNLINATATALDHHLLEQMDKKLEQMDQRSRKVAEAAADAAVERVIGTVWERAAYDAAVFDDKLRATDHRLEEHISNENVHLTPGTKR